MTLARGFMEEYWGDEAYAILPRPASSGSRENAGVRFAFQLVDMDVFAFQLGGPTDIVVFMFVGWSVSWVFCPHGS